MRTSHNLVHLASIALCLLGSYVDLHASTGQEPVAVGRPVDGARRYPAVAVSNEGRVLVAWAVEDSSSAPRGVLGRMFEPGLEPRSRSFRLDGASATSPDVAWSPSGGFAVVWARPAENPPWQIMARLFHPDGSAVGRRILVASGYVGIIESIQYSRPRVAFTADQWLVAWRGVDFDIRFEPSSWLGARLLDTDGEFTIDQVFLWSMNGQIEGFDLVVDPELGEVVDVMKRGDDVTARRYNSRDGALATTVVASSPAILGAPVGAAVDGKGRTAAAWVEDGLVRYRRILRDGRARGPRRPNPAEDLRQDDPAVAALPDGHLLIVWEQTSSDAEGSRLFARWFDRADRVASDVFRIGDAKALDQRRPAVAADRDRGAVAVWEELLPDGSVQVFAQYLDRPSL